MYKYLWIILLLVSNLNAQTITTPVERHGKLSVSGNKIVDKDGEVVSFAGNSFFWSNVNWGAEPFYKREVVEYLKDQWNTAIVRVALGVEDVGGYLSNPVPNEERLTTVVDAATELGLYVIIDWHSHHAEDHKDDAVAFFEKMATRYKDHPNVIFEIYNEPLAVSWTGVLKPYAEDVISAIRAKGADNLVIVGTPNWSQDVDDVIDNTIAGANIAYTIHFYAGTHGNALRAKALNAINNGIPLFCTEWGTVDASGDGAVDRASTTTWMAFLKEHDISHCNWSITNKDEGASVFTPATNDISNLSDANLTESGAFVKDIILGWGSGNGQAIIQAAWTSHSDSSNAQGLSFAYEILESGNNWFNAQIVISNTSTTIIDGYTLGFTAPWGVQEFWNDVTGTETNDVFSVPIFGHDFLSQINPGDSVSIGFTGSGTFSEPTDITWNGEALTDSGVSYEEWSETYNVAGKNEDDDSDGFSNLSEYFSGTLPHAANSMPEITSSILQQGDEEYLMVEFLTDPNTADVEYRLQVSNSLDTWAALEGAGGMELMNTEELANGMLKVQWRSVNAMESSTPSFFTRLELR